MVHYWLEIEFQQIKLDLSSIATLILSTSGRWPRFLSALTATSAKPIREVEGISIATRASHRSFYTSDYFALPQATQARSYSKARLCQSLSCPQRTHCPDCRSSPSSTNWDILRFGMLVLRLHPCSKTCRWSPGKRIFRPLAFLNFRPLFRGLIQHPHPPGDFCQALPILRQYCRSHLCLCSSLLRRDLLY